MAAAAKMNCYCCGEPVAVRVNRANRAYYHCGHCGLTATSKDSDSTERMLNAAPNKNVVPTEKPTHAKPTIPIFNPVPVADAVLPAAPRKATFKTLMDN
jgi:hypothetical protein